MCFQVLCKCIYPKRGRPQTNRQNIPTAGTSHQKRSQTSVSPMTGNNDVTMSSRSQSRSTRHQRSTSAIVSKISRDRTMQAFKHNHTQFVCNALGMHLRTLQRSHPAIVAPYIGRTLHWSHPTSVAPYNGQPTMVAPSYPTMVAPYNENLINNHAGAITRLILV